MTSPRAWGYQERKVAIRPSLTINLRQRAKEARKYRNGSASDIARARGSRAVGICSLWKRPRRVLEVSQVSHVMRMVRCTARPAGWRSGRFLASVITRTGLGQDTRSETAENKGHAPVRRPALNDGPKLAA